jgi:hypothetical protein
MLLELREGLEPCQRILNVVKNSSTIVFRDKTSRVSAYSLGIAV